MCALKLPQAEQQCQQLAELIRPHLDRHPLFIGIYTGGAWVAERLKRLLSLEEGVGFLDVSFYRDDYDEKGLHSQIKPTEIPFAIENRHVILVDDVLYTGRTTRAAISEVFDYGRPASIELAVLADRGGRQLPFSPNYCVWQADIAPGQNLVLRPDANDLLMWSLKDHA